MTIYYTENVRAPYPSSTDSLANAPTIFQETAQLLDSGGVGPIATRVLEGTLGSLPSPGSVPFGTFYRCTDVTCAFLRTRAGTWQYLTVGQSLPPIGTIHHYGGLSDPVDVDGVTRWMICDGRAISRSTYSSCFSIVGSAYGSGDGSTTFNIPDGRARVFVGAGQGSGLTNRALASTGGEEAHTVTIAEMASHTHPDSGHGHTAVDSGHYHNTANYPSWIFVCCTPNTGQGVDNEGSNYTTAASSSFSFGTTTGTGYASVSVHTAYAGANNTPAAPAVAHENRQPFVAISHIIRVL